MQESYTNIIQLKENEIILNTVIKIIYLGLKTPYSKLIFHQFLMSTNLK